MFDDENLDELTIGLGKLDIGKHLMQEIFDYQSLVANLV